MSDTRFCGKIATGHDTLDLTGRPLVMAVLNVTPDSFSDGGDHVTTDGVAGRVERILAEGANVIDVGGESTRPGSDAVSAETQIQRVVPAIRAIREASDRIPISIDTRLASVAEAALDAGADIINDVAALRDDPALADLAASRGVPVVLMHMLGRPKDMQVSPRYDDVVADVIAFLRERTEAAILAGIARDRIIWDPGIGFGKTTGHNLELIRNLGELIDRGHPVLFGPSRKRFIGQILGIDEPKDRQWGTAAAVTAAVLAGVHIVRVHDVRAMREVSAMAWAIKPGSRHAADGSG